MNNIEIVNRQKRNFEQVGTTTVRTLRKILESVGYELADKHCWITKKGQTPCKATHDYVLEAEDAISFDSLNELPARPLKITVETATQTTVINMHNVKGKVIATIA